MESVYYKGKEFQVKNGNLKIIKQDDLDLTKIEGLKDIKNLKHLSLWKNNNNRMELPKKTSPNKILQKVGMIKLSVYLWSLLSLQN